MICYGCARKQSMSTYASILTGSLELIFYSHTCYSHSCCPFMVTTTVLCPSPQAFLIPWSLCVLYFYNVIISKMLCEWDVRDYTVPFLELVFSLSTVLWRSIPWCRCTTVYLTSHPLSLTGMAQWGEQHPTKRKVTGSIPGQGTCLGCRFGPWLVMRGN